MLEAIPPARRWICGALLALTLCLAARFETERLYDDGRCWEPPAPLLCYPPALAKRAGAELKRLRTRARHAVQGRLPWGESCPPWTRAEVARPVTPGCDINPQCSRSCWVCVPIPLGELLARELRRR